MWKQIMSVATEELIRALKQARARRGLSQRALGAKAGLPQSHVSKIENGGADIRLSSLVELARVLELEPMLVPRRLVPAVEAIISPTPISERAYTLDDEDDE